jgi:hypothetical protein
MIKKIQIFVLIMLLTGYLFSDKVGTLPEVMKPDNITIFGNELYIVEGATIYIYSLKDLSLIRKFGKAGEGPGELRATPFFPTRITVSSDFILGETRSKLVYFSKDGKLIKEKRKPNNLVMGFIPIGKNFVATRMHQEEDKLIYNCTRVYDSDLKEIKELYRQKWVQQGIQPPAIKLYMIMDFTNYRVYDDKIFIEESAKGFVIEAFDKAGNKLYQIKKDYEKIKVTDEQKEEIINRFKEDPVIKIQANQQGGWNEIKKLFTMIFPEAFPAIQDIGISNNIIYVQTYKVINNKEEYLVLDLKGNIVKKVFIPKFEGTPIMARILGAKLHTIKNNKLYYLTENIDEEEWELHAEEIK